MTYGSEYGAVLPNQQRNPLDTWMMLKDRQLQQDRYDQQVRKQERARQDQLMNWAQDQLDFKNFATGTPADRTIISTLGDGIKSLAQKIAENPDMSSAALLYEAQGIASNVTSYSNKAKSIRANVEAAAKALSKNPSLDVSKLQKGALTSAFLKYDPNTHSMVVKDPSEIDDQQDYVSDYLNQYPENVVTGNKAFIGLVKSADKKTYEKETTTDSGGIKRSIAFKGEYYPAFNELVDMNGNPVKDVNGLATGVRVKGTPLKDGTMVADDNAYNYFTSDPGSNAWLNAQVKTMGIDPNSDEGQLFKKRLLYKHLEENNPGFINNTKNDVNQDAWRAKRDMGILINAVNGSSKKESPFAVLGQVSSGNVSDGITTDDGLVDVTNVLPNAALFSGKVVKTPGSGAVKDAYSNVLFDPKTNKLFVNDSKYEKDAKGNLVIDENTMRPVVTYERTEIKDPRTWVRQIARANGFSPDKAWEDFSKNYQPKPLTPEQQAEAELQKIKPKNPLLKLFGSIGNWKPK